MPHHTLRRIAVAGVFATLIAITSGGLVAATSSGAACVGWPLCANRPEAGLAYWIAFGHRGSVLVAAALAAWGAIAAWRTPQVERWVRLLMIAAPLLGALQIAIGALIVQLRLFGATDASHLALALLALTCQVVAAALLIQPRTELARTGGRAAREARRLRRLSWWSAGATGVLTLALSARAGTAPAVGMATLLPANALGMLAISGGLASAMFWQTWRSRPSDRLLVGGTALLTVLIAAEGILLLLPPSTAGFGVGLGALAWSLALLLIVLVARRPVSAGRPGPAIPVITERLSLVRDYLSLTKPKVIALLLATTLAAMYITEAGPPAPWLVFWTMVGGYLAAGGAGAINCALDSDIDRQMGRTSRRPVPSGRISRRSAMRFGLILSILALLVLLIFTTPLAMLLAGLGIFYYALFYTRWLKCSTWQNIIIGGGAGAIPPLVGWTAVTGELSLAAVMLSAIIFYWTPPHFWALALVKQKDYTRAGVPMLPVVAGEAETRRQILVYSALMAALSTLLTAIGAMGLIYLGSAIFLGLIFLRYAWSVWQKGDQASIWGLYKYSLLYLALLFAAMALDRLITA